MANWTVTAKWTKQGNGLAWDVLATFVSDDNRTFTDVSFNGILSQDNARRCFGNQIAQYEAANFSPSDGVFDMAAPVPPVVEPSAAELAQRDFNAKRAALLRAKEDLSVSLITQTEFDATQADAVTAKSALADAAKSVEAGPAAALNG